MKKVAIALYIIQVMSLFGIFMGGGSLAGRSLPNLIGVFLFAIIATVLLIIAKQRENPDE